MVSRVLAVVFLAAWVASAATVVIPVAFVDGTNPSGVSFVTTQTWNPEDTLTLYAGGLVFLQSGPMFGTNAGGVVVVPGSGGNVGGTLTYPAASSTVYGQLLLGNASIGYLPLFLPAASGAGSGAPPAQLALDRVTLGSLGFTNPIAAGTTLNLVVNDSIFSDNSGGYSLSQVPEPSTLGLIGGALAALGIWRRRRS